MSVVSALCLSVCLSQLRDVEWTSHSCILSFTVCGQCSLSVCLSVSLSVSANRRRVDFTQLYSVIHCLWSVLSVCLSVSAKRHRVDLTQLYSVIHCLWSVLSVCLYVCLSVCLSQLRDVEWTSHSCTLSFIVCGQCSLSVCLSLCLSQLRDVEWTSHSCTLSFTVCGQCSLSVCLFRAQSNPVYFSISAIHK